VFPKLPKRTSESDPGVQISGYFGFKPINRGIGLPLRVDRDTKHNESRVKKSGCSMNERGLYTEKLPEREIREARDKKRCREKRNIVNLDLASEKSERNLPTLISMHLGANDIHCRNSLLKFKRIR
jgi:hypothetical protein